MQFRILGSSSAGNAALLQTDHCQILIDAGFSARRISRLLDCCGESLETIDAVFLTHEHHDHAAGLTGISRLPRIKIFANYKTARAVQDGLKRRANWSIFETGTTFQYRDLEVTTFSVPHDAHDPVGFLFSQGEGDLFSPRRSIAWCIDLGHLPQLVRERTRNADILVLEANHEIRLLDEDPRRPWSVKQRIKSRHGHLSNASAWEFILSEDRARWKRVFLAHLSRDCNDVSLLSEMFGNEDTLRSRNCSVNVIHPDGGPTPPFAL